jgi:hypothetical protein
MAQTVLVDPVALTPRPSFVAVAGAQVPQKCSNIHWHEVNNILACGNYVIKLPTSSLLLGSNLHQTQMVGQYSS